MKILMIVPKYSLTHEPHYDYPFPMGLGYIVSVLKKAGRDVHCINLNHLCGSTEDLINKALDSEGYDFVCTGNNALGYSVTEAIITTAKKHHSHPKTILGGHIITSEPELVFNSLKPDFGIIGEGEETIIELLDFIEKNRNLNEVYGIVYSIDGKTVKTQNRKAIDDLDTVPLPDFESLGFKEQLDNMHTNYIYYSTIFDRPRIYPLLASRSCPYQCTFCYHDSKYRKRSIKNIMKELNEMVKKYKINIINMYDECFAIDKKRLSEFCEKIQKLKKEIEWDLKWTCQLRVDSVDSDVLKKMRDAGCYIISYGFESYSADVLKSMRKYITPQQIDHAFKITLEEKIGVQANFIFGDIAETKETAKITLDYWKNTCQGQVNLDFIQPYPGSGIYQHCIKKRIIKDKLNFIKNEIGKTQWFNMTEKMSDNEIINLKKEILKSISKYSKFVRPTSVKRTGGLKRKNIYEVKLTCPFCDNREVYGNFLIKNKLTYGYDVMCRRCYKQFYVVSFVQRIAFKNYSMTESIMSSYLAIRRSIKKKAI